MASPDDSDSPPTRRWDDEAVESAVELLLRAGVLLAAALVFAGGLVYLVRHGSAPLEGRVFSGEPLDLKQVAGIVRGGLALRGRPLIMCGLLVLIATPVARVGVSLVAFLQQRDRAYVAMTALVLVILVAGMLGWAL